METTQTTPPEGTAVPTPETVMPNQDSAPTADPASQEAKPSELRVVIGEALGRNFSTDEEAKENLRNLKSLVGDQTVAKQRKALEKLAEQANLTPAELIEVIETQDLSQQPTQSADRPIQTPDPNSARLTRIEVDNLVREQPDAAVIKETLFAEALATGKPASDIWAQKYAPILEAGKKVGAKKLQTNREGQPTKAASTASEETGTKLDFSKMTSKEMEKHLGFTQPTPRI